ncbi:MAG: aminoacyl-tRNA hydrolase [Verrucomicrobiia bacterium]
MHLIVGLGNPGREYAETRHNAGFMAVEQFAERRQVAWGRQSKFRARLARGAFDGRPFVLCEPETFMNLSGVAVQALVAFYKAPVDQTLIVVDDADLPLGSLRMRTEGSSGGHHGLESIEQHLGTRTYPRLRVGIGRNIEGPREITDYVLARFDRSEMALLRLSLERACDQMECWMKEGAAKAMSEFNGLVNTPLVKES